MTVALTQPTTIPIPWPDYVAGNFDTAAIPWERYRYSGTGVVKVAPEAPYNGIIAKRLERKLEALVDDPDRQIFRNIMGVEVPFSDHEERIPDLVVIDPATVERLNLKKSCVITLDMPSPLLIVEVVSPSSTKEDIEVKAMEYVGIDVTDYLAIHWQNNIIYGWSRHLNSYRLTEYAQGDRLQLVSFPQLIVTVDELLK